MSNPASHQTEMSAELALIEAISRIGDYATALSDALTHMNYQSSDNLHVALREEFASSLAQVQTIAGVSLLVFTELCKSHELRSAQ